MSKEKALFLRETVQNTQGIKLPVQLPATDFSRLPEKYNIRCVKVSVPT